MTLYQRLRPYTLRPWYAGIGCSMKAYDDHAKAWIEQMITWEPITGETTLSEPNSKTDLPDHR
jgi:hypothetical protein